MVAPTRVQVVTRAEAFYLSAHFLLQAMLWKHRSLPEGGETRMPVTVPPPGGARIGIALHTAGDTKNPFGLTGFGCRPLNCRALRDIPCASRLGGQRRS